ncbi:pilus assembly protein [Neobacillus notoginsengisoli]|uniref:Pilus assembly protein n=1 Tax=Neobacillus notoginsengisoli TaxID=1578198 RepID=A0A417YXS5_9BACI|nr:TadE family protein [Neobacillus notoginsengisoli]RHW42546.1 pilus assembly protein [Neobacillus notoginsengisoli]
MKSEKGQSMVETALILPILVIMLFGIVDFGRLLHAYLALDHAGREAARAISIQEDPPTVLATTKNSLKNKNIDAIVKIKETKIESGKPVTVIITHNFKFITPLVSFINGLKDYSIENSTVMRVE